MWPEIFLHAKVFSTKPRFNNSEPIKTAAANNHPKSFKKEEILEKRKISADFFIYKIYQ